MRKTLTIFTPAYNRAHTLVRTYRSLCAQTCKDFVWLIIDDGSTDETGNIVKAWAKEKCGFEIRYVYQQNQGMHGAHNTAYRNIDTMLNTCIDSDDYMPKDAVAKIVALWKEHGCDKYAGIIGLDQDECGKIIGTPFKDGVKKTTLQEFYAKGGKGDKKLVYRTDVIRQYPEYPIFEGEKYVGLAYKYMLIDQDYELLTLNEPLVTVDYQPEGSSYNMYRQYWNNPKGFAFFRRTEMLTTKSVKRKFVVCAHYVSSCVICRDWAFVKKSPCKIMTILAIPAGAALYFFIRHKYNSNQKMNFKK